MLFRSSLRVVIDALASALFVVLVLLLFGSIEFFFAFAPLDAFAYWYRWVAWVVFALAIGALATSLAFLFNERVRTRLLTRSSTDGLMGWLTPFLLAGFVFFLAVSVFSVTAFVFQQAGVAHLAIAGCKAPCRFGTVQLETDLSNFFIWHFLDAVPLLDATQSLQWQVPLVYQGALMGWLVISFKVAVIAPLVQLVRLQWKARTTTPRLRIRPWVWPRVAKAGAAVHLSWAPRHVDEDSGFLFVVTGTMTPRRLTDPLAGEQVIYSTTQPGGDYLLETDGKVRFRAQLLDHGSPRASSRTARVRVYPSDR